jgi:hypothetical protein
MRNFEVMSESFHIDHKHTYKLCMSPFSVSQNLQPQYVTLSLCPDDHRVVEIYTTWQGSRNILDHSSWATYGGK